MFLIAAHKIENGTYSWISTHIMFSNDCVPQSQKCGIFGVAGDEWKKENEKIL